MNKEELIGKLQMCYFGDRNALNELVGYYDGLKQGIEQLQHELEQERNIRKEATEYCNTYTRLSAKDLLEILNKEVK